MHRPAGLCPSLQPGWLPSLGRTAVPVHADIYQIQVQTMHLNLPPPTSWECNIFELRTDKNNGAENQCAGLQGFAPAFSLAGFRASAGLLYLSANAAGNLTLDSQAWAAAASNATSLAQQPHDGSSRSLLAAFNATTLQVHVLASEKIQKKKKKKNPHTLDGQAWAVAASNVTSLAQQPGLLRSSRSLLAAFTAFWGLGVEFI